jgi:hypothetical protein
MVNIRDFSNTTIALIVIVVLASAFAVRAVTTSVPVQQSFGFTPLRVLQLQVDPNMAFSLVPQNGIVGVGDSFAVTAAIENVTDMYGWQVYVCFNETVLECTGVSLPSDNVFSNEVTVCGGLTAYKATGFPQGPLQKIQNDEGWVLAGDCLLGQGQPMFNGSGVLCQIEFTAVSPGLTTLALLHDYVHTFQSYIVTSNLTAVTSPSASYASINVSSN